MVTVKGIAPNGLPYLHDAVKQIRHDWEVDKNTAIDLLRLAIFDLK